MNTPDEPVPPAKIPPPSGLKVTVVLGAVALGIVLLCVACCVGYAFYVDLHSLR